MLLRVLYTRYSFFLLFARKYQIRYLITDVHLDTI